MKILDREWRWKHLYYIRSEAGIVKIRQRPEQLELDSLVYPAFYGGYRLEIITFKSRQVGYPTVPEEAFLHSGRPVFNQELLKALSAAQSRPPIRTTEDGIEIYEEPNPAHHYGIGVDTAEGLADGDNSVISVVCKETGHQVAEVAGKISAIEEHELARLVGIVARMYENHLCVIERNNHGHTVIAFVKNDGNVNLFRTQEVDTITGKTSEKIGWNTDRKNKAYAIDTLKKDLKEGRCVPHSVETYDELRVFVHGERGKMAALKGHHDDRVMALSLANVAAQQAGIGTILFG